MGRHSKIVTDVIEIEIVIVIEVKKGQRAGDVKEILGVESEAEAEGWVLKLC